MSQAADKKISWFEGDDTATLFLEVGDVVAHVWAFLSDENVVWQIFGVDDTGRQVLLDQGNSGSISEGQGAAVSALLRHLSGHERSELLRYQASV